MATERPERPLVAVWGLTGVAAILGWAAFRLGRRGVDVVLAGLSPLEWVALLALVAVFVYGEGVRALQRGWLPRVADRAARLARDGSWALRAVAPLHAFGLVGTPRRVAARAWLGVAAVVVAVLVVRALPEPWRGIVDLAVALALAWGAVVALALARRVPATGSLPSEPRP